jgi:competence ComEA-like helix-hairpin-helix protein
MNRALSFWIIVFLCVSKVGTQASAQPEGMIVEILHSDSEMVRLPVNASVDDALAAVGLVRRGIGTILSNGDCLDVTETTVNLTASHRALAMGERLALNSASAVALDTVPGIGPVRAAAIVHSRNESGPFEVVDDLDRVHGIGPATIKKIEPFVRAL